MVNSKIQDKPTVSEIFLISITQVSSGLTSLEVQMKWHYELYITVFCFFHLSPSLTSLIRVSYVKTGPYVKRHEVPARVSCMRTLITTWAGERHTLITVFARRSAVSSAHQAPPTNTREQWSAGGGSLQGRCKVHLWEWEENIRVSV